MSSEPDGVISNGLYCVGWLKCGPRGTILENRLASQKVAKRILENLRFCSQSFTKPCWAALNACLGQKIVTYDDRLATDSIEAAAAPEERCRAKFKTVDDMLDVVKNWRQTE